MERTAEGAVAPTGEAVTRGSRGGEVRKECQAIQCLVPSRIAMLPAAVQAISINPDASYSLRSTLNAGPATHLHDTPRDGKFDGLLLNTVGSIVSFGLGRTRN